MTACRTIACAVLAAGLAGASETVFFATGDRLPGNLAALDADVVRIDSPVLAAPAVVDPAMLLEIRGQATLPDAEAGHEAVVTLSNGDVLRGRLAAITAEAIELDTWFAGRLTLRRVMVDSLQVLDRSRLLFAGPGGREGWLLAHDGNEPAWSFARGVMSSRGSGSAAREVNLPARVACSFDLAWRGSLRFRLIVFSDEPSKLTPNNGYVLDFNRRYVSFAKHWAVGNAVNRSTIGNAGVRQVDEKEKVRVELLADTKDGNFILQIDGEQVASWRDPEAGGDMPQGRAIHFIADDSTQLRISQIRVEAWDGRAGDERTRPGAEDQPPELPEGAQQIELRNGDVVTGRVTGVVDDHLLIDTEHGAIRLPVARMSHAVLRRESDRDNPDLRHIPKLMNGDVRAWFEQGGSMVFRLDGIEDGHYLGFSQVFGTARLRRDAFHRVEFNIHEHDLEPLRPPASGW